MDKVNLVIVVAVITIFISLLLSLFLFTVKTQHKLSNRLFAFFLILIAIDISGSLFYLLNENPSNIGMFRSLFTFLQLPTFYLYVLSVCYSDFELKIKHLIHVIPFLIVNVVMLPRFYAVTLDLKLSFLEKSNSMLEIQFTHLFLHIQIIFYIILAITTLRKAKKVYLENYAGASMESLNWLFQFAIAISIFYSLAILKNIFKFSTYTDISEWLKIGLFLFELFIINWYLFKALNNPNLFRSIDSKLKLVSKIVSEEKQEDQFLENEYSKDLLLLNNYMVTEKPFLNPSLTIQDLSNAIKIPTKELSLLINHKLNQHFYDFVNSFRIQKAMEILQDNSKSKVTILEILYEVGFNSKSSFNTAFKKHTKTTPTEYRKKNRQQ